MKRAFWIFIPLLLLGALLLWGNALATRTLNAELPALLSRALGLPVHLAPARVRLSRLQAETDELVFGAADNPAVHARAVTVRLSLPALLRREIRLSFAAADDLTVRPDRWPDSGKPPPADYRYLDPWLPAELVLLKGRYVTAGGTRYPVSDLSWTRDGDRAELAWTEQRAGGAVSVRGQLASLPALLALSSMNLSAQTALADAPDAGLDASIHIAPASPDAYRLRATLGAAGSHAELQAGASEPWRLPAWSELEIDRLDVREFWSLVTRYRRTAANSDERTLPRLALPVHRARVHVAQLIWPDQIGRDLQFELDSDDTQLSVDALRITGPDIDTTGTFSLRGDTDGWDMALDAVDHRAGGDLPISASARLDNRTAQLVLDPFALTLGDAQASGRVTYTPGAAPHLSAQLHADALQFDLPERDNTAERAPGLPIPDPGSLLPGMALDLALSLTDVALAGRRLARLDAEFTRSAGGERFTVQAHRARGGELDIQLQADSPANAPRELTLTMDLQGVNLPALFGETSALYSRSTGHIRLAASGQDLATVLGNLQGRTELTTELRADNNWRRPVRAGETLSLAGDARLLIDTGRITGVQIDKLAINSSEQHLSGTLSMADGREPWLLAELHSNGLNIDHLRDLVPQQRDDGGRDALSALRGIGESRITLDADALTVGGTRLNQLNLAVTTAPEQIDLKSLAFEVRDGRASAQGKLRWRGDVAQLESAVGLERVNIDQFLIEDTTREPVPVSGTVQLHSEGRTLPELLSGVTGDVQLDAARGDRVRQLRMTATRLQDGVEARIERLAWDDNALSGTLRYQRTTPPAVQFELAGGKLSLRPWEDAYLKQKSGTASSADSMNRLAQASARFVSDILLGPFRLLSDTEETPPGQRMFTTEPLSLDGLHRLNVRGKGSLDQLDSTVISAEQLQFTLALGDGELALEATAGRIGGGRANIDLTLDDRSQPSRLAVNGEFRDVGSLTGEDTFTRSGFVSITARGDTEAALAASASGLIYLELGKGPFDYANSALLNADIASAVFRTLIPGIDRKKPKLDCGVAAMLLQDGVGGTPYGFAVRTNQANLLGQLEVDLAREQLQLKFDSRSRDGVGLSVGSVFANTVQVRGPLTAPKVVPNTGSLLFRGAAAFMTGGLSVVGESVLKRILASEDPCISLQQTIRAGLCPAHPTAAASALVCPEGGAS